MKIYSAQLTCPLGNRAILFKSTDIDKNNDLCAAIDAACLGRIGQVKLIGNIKTSTKRATKTAQKIKGCNNSSTGDWAWIK